MQQPRCPSKPGPQKWLPGQALIELALVLPLLCLVVFGIVDYGRVLNDEQIMVDLSRQGSNMASRGTTLPATAAALLSGSGILNLSLSGQVIVTSVSRVNNVDTIGGQTLLGGLSNSSKIGTGVNSKATVPAGIDDIFTKNPGQTVYITELYYTFQPITPLATMWKVVMPSTLYQVAYF
jgi:hypothetical protein